MYNSKYINCLFSLVHSLKTCRSSNGYFLKYAPIKYNKIKVSIERPLKALTVQSKVNVEIKLIIIKLKKIVLLNCFLSSFSVIIFSNGDARYSSK